MLTHTYPHGCLILRWHDLRVGKHMLDIRFWRDGEQTAFDVIKGDRKLVERRDITAVGVELRTSSAFIQTDRAPGEAQQQKRK
jgi:hypothetical protein